ncbi:hypothetical protein FB45DRAFT_921625 [Roridomyces roridus]|uniref:Uncharacterized protein n=1 Tax=Roridomyces roridus TaxID=1738132 RepID=A0AAD7FL69_9AGAR|nr:hypothetical protein FB45DRAFT_921625 [Roridomyces roridus]
MPQRDRDTLTPPQFRTTLRKAVFSKLALAREAARLASTPLLPYLPDDAWPQSLNDGDDEEEGATVSYDTYKFAGLAIFCRALFLLALPHLHGKPVGYFQTIANIVQSRQVVTKWIGDNDPDLGSVSEDGFYMFLRAWWMYKARDTSAVASFLAPFFNPLLKAAGKAYLKAYVPRQSPQRRHSFTPVTTTRSRLPVRWSQRKSGDSLQVCTLL